MKNFLLGVMATVLCVSLLGAKFQDAAPKKYELKSLAVRVDAGEKDQLSNAGWRVVGYYHRPNIGDAFPSESIYIFEREKR